MDDTNEINTTKPQKSLKKIKGFLVEVKISQKNCICRNLYSYLLSRDFQIYQLATDSYGDQLLSSDILII